MSGMPTIRYSWFHPLQLSPVPSLHLLPLRVATIGAYTPFGAACGLFAPLLGGSLSPQASATAVLYAAAAVLLAVRRLDRLVRNGGLTV